MSAPHTVMDADDVRVGPAPVEDTPLFAQLAAAPVPSVARHGSEATADHLTATKAHVSRELMVLERLARGPVTVDQFITELREHLGDASIERSSYAPRFTSLVAHGYASYDATREQRTTMGGTASPYRITDAGRAALAKRAAILREREADRTIARRSARGRGR